MKEKLLLQQTLLQEKGTIPWVWNDCDSRDEKACLIFGSSKLKMSSYL